MQRNPALRPRPVKHLKTIVLFLLTVLAARVLYLIIVEYPSYFPPDFDSAFLTGREDFFYGFYQYAFYAHIICGPLALLAGFVLMFSGWTSRWHRMHRCLGRIHVANVVVVLAPSGLVMATHAYTGPVAGIGFGLLAVATAGSALATVHYAMAGKLVSHRAWATRCFILLCAPLLLRLMSGVVIVFQRESVLTYQLSAWLSWIVPLAVFEIWSLVNNQASSGISAEARHVPTTKNA